MAAKLKVDELESVDGSTNLILNNSVTMAATKTLPAASLTGTLPANTVDSDAYVDGSIDLAHMSANSVDSAQYVDGSIDGAHIANDVIDSQHYAAASIDNEHLADDAVDSDELAAGAVDLAHMSVNSVDSDQYVDGSIDTVHIADDQVTPAKLGGIARGRMIIGDSNGDPAAIAVGSANQVLFSNGTDISWSSLFGKQTIWIPANAMKPKTTNGCADMVTVETTPGPDMHVLDFVHTADKYALFQIAFPKSWNLGTITYQVFWSGIAATTGVCWRLSGVAIGDNEDIGVSYGNGTDIQDDAQGAVEELLVTAESGAVTIAGTPADDNLCYFQINREVADSNDDMAGDARLHGIKLFFTTDANNDA